MTGGATVWITGLPAAGKTTLALALAELLTGAGADVRVLDGDILRRGPSRGLGFSRQDRGLQAARAGAMAAEHAGRGGVAVVALVSPYREHRDAARKAHADRSLPFVEVWVDTPLAECEQRDPKGLYARARAGEVTGLTGIDAPYQEPDAAEVVVDPGHTPDGAARLVAAAVGFKLQP